MRNTHLQLTDLDFYCFPTSDNILSYSISMIFQKDFHLISQIDFLIREIVESGLLFKWIEDSGRVIPNDNKIDESELEIRNIILTMEHVQGAYLILGIGCFTAFIVLLLECFIHYYTNK
jgi:hypothetical protein